MRGALLLPLVSLAIGCAGPTIELRIDAAARAKVSGLTVEVAASRRAPPDWEVCEPTLAVIDPSLDPGWPVVVSVEQGEGYRDALAFRVLGLDGAGAEGPPLVGWARWPEEGSSQVDLTLPDCGEARCAEGQQLTLGCSCEPEPIPPLFDDGGYWTRGVSCAAER